MRVRGIGERDRRAEGGRFRLAPVSMLLGCGALLSADSASGQMTVAGSALPFHAGEDLRFRVTSSRFGQMGSARMRVEGPERMEGRDVLVLSMETRGRVLLVGYEDEATSWLDPDLMASVRYEKEEHHPLASREESVRMILAEGRWEGGGEEGGPLGADAPLDELSFIYFLRTLELEAGTEQTFTRHFDRERNPVRVRVLERGTLTVPAGTFAAVEVEMRVRDPRRFEDGGEALIRLHLSDDHRRIPLRIESTAPWVGTVVMTLQSASPPVARSGMLRAAQAP